MGMGGWGEGESGVRGGEGVVGGWGVRGVLAELCSWAGYLLHPPLGNRNHSSEKVERVAFTRSHYFRPNLKKQPLVTLLELICTYEKNIDLSLSQNTIIDRFSIAVFLPCCIFGI